MLNRIIIVHGSRFGFLQDSEDEQGVLGGEDSQEHGAGLGRAAEGGCCTEVYLHDKELRKFHNLRKRKSSASLPMAIEGEGVNKIL